MYKVALEASKSKGDTSKARRYERAIGNLNQMVSDVRGGKKINLDDLPPEVSVPTAPATSTGSNKATSSNVATGSVKDDEDDLNELAKWIGGPSVDAPPISKKPSLDTSVIDDRLKLYQDALKVAEDQKDSSKTRRYKRAVDTIISLQKEVKGGKKFSEEDLPPVISIVVPKKAPPTTPPTQSTKPKLPTEIDLDAPEFDEFNLSEEDMAAMMSSFLDDRNKAPPPPEPAKPTPPKPAPRTKPVTTPPRAPPPNTGPPVAPKPSDAITTSRPPGLIDLDTPEFAEFDLSEEDMAMLAAQMEQSAKKSQVPIVPSPRPSEDNSQSLPAKITHPVDTGETVTKDQVKLVLMERKDQYMKAMQGAKAKGDTVGQKKYGTVAVQFDRALKGLEQDQVMDLKGIPPPPPGFASIYNYDVSLYKSTPPKAPPSQTASPQSSVTPQESSLPPDDSIPVPKTPLEALEQRLEKYHQGLKSAQEKGESSRVRRTNRIIKQYEDAIKMTKAGKEVDYDELPVPPGYPPIPAAPKPRPVQPRPAESRPVQSLPASVPQMKLKASVNDQQIQLLRQRGAELQRAAKEAKANGDKDTAIRYVRFFKGVEQMLSAAQSGMPVDMSQVNTVDIFNIVEHKMKKGRNYFNFVISLIH
jgi:coiled-coil and C2 domain-containing protein 1